MYLIQERKPDVQRSKYTTSEKVVNHCFSDCTLRYQPS